MSETEPAQGRDGAGRRWLIAFAAATVLAFPHHLAGRAIDLGLFMAPWVPAFLLLGISGLGVRGAARRAFVASLVGHFVLFHWFYVVTVSYGHAPAFLGVLAPLAPALYLALGTAIFAAGWAWLQGHGRGSPLAAALLWTVVDHLRGFALGGFPWATIGYAQHQNPLLLGLAPFTGVYGLSFAIALAGAALAMWIRESGLRRAPSRPVALALVGLALLHGPGLLRSPTPEPSERIRVAALQGNIDQGEKWSRSRASEILAIYLELSQQAIDAGAQVVVWPETAVPGLIEVEPQTERAIASLARENRVAFVLGATGATFDPSGSRITAVFDSAFLMDPEGTMIARYDKTHLVPFGEYVPLRALIGSFFKAIARGLANTDVQAGDRPRAYALPVAPRNPAPSSHADLHADRRDVIVGVPICYELLFPDLVRRFADDGARVLFAITNDAWYGRTGAPHQFLAMTAMRSAESRLWTVRAANSGVSAIIDERGRVHRRSGIFERAFVIDDVPLAASDGSATFYARHGDVFAYVCWLGVLALGTITRSRKER